MTTHAELEIAGQSIDLGETATIELDMGQGITGGAIRLPVHVQRGPRPGPTVLVTGAVHGDEYNGAAVVRHLITNPASLSRGSLVLVPVVNILAFEQRTRYMPDRRDLNRCFPGLTEGSLSSRYAATFFQEVVQKCSCGVDLHSAASPRTNYPNVRADLGDSECQKLAKMLGCEIVLDAKGIVGTLRREATTAGIPTVLLEAGETMRIEPGMVSYALGRVMSVLAGLGMVEGEPAKPKFQAVIKKNFWIRADFGGILHFHVSAGDVVRKGQRIATQTNVIGDELAEVRSSSDGFVIGMTTAPTVLPGDPICHLAVPRGGLKPILNAISDSPALGLV